MTMETNDSSARRMARLGGRVLGHGAAIVLGLVLMVVGLALGVAMVTLPIGLPLGLAGLLLVLWGASASIRGKRTPT
jgi:hypothetical protein